MPILTINKHSNLELSDHFNSNEFDCRCRECTKTLIDQELIDKLEKLRLYIRHPIIITNGFRCIGHNEYLIKQGYKASRKSQHLLGKAADLVLAQGRTVDKFAELAEKAGFTGIGKYNWGIHVDTRVISGRWDYR